jgi:hypothetical protein
LIYTLYLQVDDLGGLMAVATANAQNIQGARGALGLLNRLGDWALLLAHRARANTVRTFLSIPPQPLAAACVS